MNITFPNNPTDGQEYLAANGVTYIWEQDNNTWVGAFRPSVPIGATGATGIGLIGATGATGIAGTNGGIGATGPIGYTGSQGILDTSSVITVPTTTEDIGCYRILATSTGDGTAFSRGTILAGSNLRGVGYFTLSSVSGATFNHTVSSTYQIFNLSASNTRPADGSRVLFTNNIPTGSWLSMGAIGAVTIAYDGVSSASWINYRFVFLAVRVA